MVSNSGLSALPEIGFLVPCSYRLTALLVFIILCSLCKLCLPHQSMLCEAKGHVCLVLVYIPKGRIAAALMGTLTKDLLIIKLKHNYYIIYSKSYVLFLKILKSDSNFMTPKIFLKINL